VGISVSPTLVPFKLEFYLYGVYVCGTACTAYVLLPCSCSYISIPMLCRYLIL